VLGITLAFFAFAALPNCNGS